MLSLHFGAIIMLAVLGYALSGMNWQVLLNLHTFILVIGGTVGVFGLSTPWADIRRLVSALKNLRKQDITAMEINKTLIELSVKKAAANQSVHPLIEYAAGMWNEGIDREMFTALLSQKLQDLNRSTENAVTALKNLAKYPPALGMVGTVLGMVALFSNLTPEAKSSIGPNLAFAMTATFYGLVLTNAVLMPMADRLLVLHMRRVGINEHVFHILKLINRGEPSTLVQSEVYGTAA